jgi:hypothetical protein
MSIITKKKLAITTSLILVTLISGVYAYLFYDRADEPRIGNHQIYISNLTKETLDKSIALSAKYLANSCNDQGRFLYRVNLDPSVKIKPKYNTLRHAGSVYALAMYTGRNSDGNIRNALLRSARFLIEKAIRPIPERDDLLAVWSPAKMCGREGRDKVKLGGTGIGLVALIEAEKVIPGLISLEKLRRMGRFILYMQKNDGSFYSKYLPEWGGRDDSWTSLYYPGEAALGLLMLYEKDPSSEWLQGAASAMSYLSKIRHRKVIVEADHWALLATESLLKAGGNFEQTVTMDVVIRHGIKICRSILGGVSRYHEESPEYGALTESGSTTQTAIRLEGLLATMSFLPDNDDILNKQIVSAVREGMVFLLRSQIQQGKYIGGFPRIAPFALMNKKENRSDKDRDTEIRIDYVQHAMCAMMQYSDTFF